MPDVFGLLSKLLSNEPLERLMYMVIIFVSAMLFIPASIQAMVNDKVGIPYAYQIAVFALSFALAVNAQRFFLFMRKAWKGFQAKKEKREVINYVNQVIDSFTDGQTQIIASALSRHYPVITATRNDPDIKSLVDSRVLVPQEGQLLPNENPYCVLNVSDIFWRILLSRWNAYTGEIE